MPVRTDSHILHMTLLGRDNPPPMSVGETVLTTADGYDTLTQLDKGGGELKAALRHIARCSVSSCSTI